MWAGGVRRGKTGSDCRGHSVLNQDGRGGESMKGGSKMLTIKHLPCGDSLKVSYFFTTFHRGKNLNIVSSKFKLQNTIRL